MLFGNSNLSSFIQQVKNLPFYKVPLYYIPTFASFYYCPREVFMLLTSFWIYDNLNKETERRKVRSQYGYWDSDPEYEETSEEESTHSDEDCPSLTESSEEEDIINNIIKEDNIKEEDTIKEEENIEEENIDEEQKTENKPESDEDYNIVEEAIEEKPSSWWFWNYDKKEN